MAAAVGCVGALLLLEPDFGAFVVIVCIAMGILFLGGINGAVRRPRRDCWWCTFMAAHRARRRIAASASSLTSIRGTRYAWARRYQLSHSLIAFGRGEWFGVGLGGSVEKLHYLPEAHTDFLLAVIAEELGFAGVLVVIAAVLWISRAPSTIGRQASRIDQTFAGLVAQGHRHLDRRADLHQHGREHGPAADQGPDAAAAELRRHRHR